MASGLQCVRLVAPARGERGELPGAAGWLNYRCNKPSLLRQQLSPKQTDSTTKVRPVTTGISTCHRGQDSHGLSPVFGFRRNLLDMIDLNDLIDLIDLIDVNDVNDVTDVNDVNDVNDLIDIGVLCH